jgi:hypothetical protein
MGLKKILPVFAGPAGSAQAETAVGQGVGQGGEHPGPFEQIPGVDRHVARLFAEMISPGFDQPQIGETEVHHHPADGADVERSLGFNENDADGLAFHSGAATK